MPLLGAHMSIAGGLHNAFLRLRQVRGEALQIFLKNQRQWHPPPLSAHAVRLFQEERDNYAHIPVAAHDSYLINLAAPDPDTAEKSVAAFASELDACAQLGIEFLILHPGFHCGAGISTGIARFAKNLDRACALAKAHSVTVLIETTAGQGSGIGSKFEEIADMLMKSKAGRPLGVCFDTCHAFAAGYDLRDERSCERTFDRFDKTIGLRFLRWFHLNDSKAGFGSRVDRHEHIGRGRIGLQGFRLLVNDPRFESHPMVLETPKGKDLRNDRKNLATLRSLLRAVDDSESEPFEEDREADPENGGERRPTPRDPARSLKRGKPSDHT